MNCLFNWETLDIGWPVQIMQLIWYRRPFLYSQKLFIQKINIEDFIVFKIIIEAEFTDLCTQEILYFKLIDKSHILFYIFDL